MSQDPQVRDQAAGVLSGLFSHLGSRGTQPAPAGLGALSGQLTEFLELPVELTRISVDMSVQLTELVLRSLEEAGIELARGLMP